MALRAGFTPEEIVFTGVGKSRAELERAVSLGLKAINAESPGEVERIEAIAAAQGRRARVAVRVNPNVDAGSHPHISTGHHDTKFGMSVDAARALAQQVTRRPHLQIVGLHAHIGSQITKPEPIAQAADTVAALASELMAQGIHLEHVDGAPRTASAGRPRAGQRLRGGVVLDSADWTDARPRADDGWSVQRAPWWRRSST